MTPPGEKLEFKEGPVFTKELRVHERAGNLDLFQAIDTAIRHASPGTIKRLWRKRSRNGSLSVGCKVRLEHLNQAGMPALFEVFYIEQGSKRDLVMINDGPFDEISIGDFCTRYEGVPFERRQR